MRNAKRVLFGCLLALAGLLPTAAQAFDLGTTADTYTKSASPTQNQGGSQTMHLKAGSQPAWGYLKFDLSSLSVALLSAKVKLGGGGPSGTVVSLYPLADTSWGESTLTWNNQPAAGGTALASATMAASPNQWYVWDITAYAQAELAAGRSVISVVVKPSGGSNSSDWTFNEREAAGFHPYIEINGASQPSGPWKVGFIHTDHLNTPRLITNDAGQALWRWEQQEPFGVSPPDENPSGLGVYEFNKRFDGQYYDKETNQHYNYLRDCYDPATGRYCQSDPIGLLGG